MLYLRNIASSVRRQGYSIAAVLLVVLVAGPLSGLGAEFSAQAAVESQEVYLGEPFTFQVQVSGADSPDRPDVSGISDFTVRELGASRSSQSSFTIVVNGRQVKNESGSETVFNYELVATKAGILGIPPITVTAQGKTTRTQPIRIRANNPAESDDFKLRQTLSKASCYVGEPVVLRVTWYIGTKVGNYQLSLPVLGVSTFAFADQRDGQRSQVQLANGTVSAVQRREELDGRQYDAVEFSKVLIPKRSGTFEVPAATIVCAALTGRQKQQSPFGDDFPFFNQTRDVYKKVVVPSGAVTLDVLPVPPAGRPANFAGHVGEYRIAASATPVDVNVGDPITLTIALSGPEYLENVELPSLAEQPALARDFKIPTDMADGKVAGGAKVFTQSIRALREDVQAIPPLELAYFDTRSGKYGVAKSASIPLRVRPTRVVTAGISDGGSTVIPGSALEAWGKGIAHNYEGAELLVDRQSGPAVWLRSPLWICSISLPPLVYIAMLALTVVIRRRNADPRSLKARRAFGEFTKAAKGVGVGAGGAAGGAAAVLLDAMREYLGCRLKVPSAAMSYREVESLLKTGGVDPVTMSALKHFFDQCEAESYAGGSAAGGDAGALVKQALAVARAIERKLK
ncbi:MAG: BatD family protein [bacterium]